MTAPAPRVMTASLRLDEFLLPFGFSHDQLSRGTVLVIEARPARSEQNWELLDDAEQVAYELATVRVREQRTGREFTAWITLGAR